MKKLLYWKIQSIRRPLTRPVLQSLVVSLAMPRLDYGNAMLAGLPDNQLSQLQSVLNAAAWLVFSARKHEAVSPLLRDLHWLRLLRWIDFKPAVLTYHCLHLTAPPYLADELHSVADRLATAVEVSVSVDTRRTVDAPFYHWRLRLSGRGFARME